MVRVVSTLFPSPPAPRISGLLSAATAGGADTRLAPATAPAPATASFLNISRRLVAAFNDASSASRAAILSTRWSFSIPPAPPVIKAESFGDAGARRKGRGGSAEVADDV